MIMRIIVYCSAKTMSQKSPTELYEKVAKTREDACSEKWSKARHSREMERERRVWGAKWGVFGRVRHEMGTKGREEKKRGGTPWAATAFRHVTFLFTSGCNTHDPHYWLSLTPFHRHIRAAYAQARMWTHKRIKTRTLKRQLLFFSPARLRKVFIVSFLSPISSSFFPAELQWWHSWVAEGIQSCPTSLVTQHCCMFPCAPRETWSQYLEVAHTQRNRKYRED